MCKPTNKEELKKIIENRIQTEGPECNLNDIDVSDITDMSDLFNRSEFDGDISEWDVSNVTNMNGMFLYSQFNGNIGKWNVSNVTYMCAMFARSQFNGDISEWDVTEKISNQDSWVRCNYLKKQISTPDVPNKKKCCGRLLIKELSG